MARTNSEEDEKDDKQSKVSFHHIRGDLHSYSKRKLESVVNTLMDGHQSVISKKDQLIDEYASLRKENVNLEKNDHCIQNKMKEPRNDLYPVIKKNEALHKELHITKIETTHNMRWKRSSIMLDNIQKGQFSTRHGIGFNQNSIEITNFYKDCLCIHYGLTRHKSNACPKKLKEHANNLRFLKKPGGERITKLVPNLKPYQNRLRKISFIPFLVNKDPSGSWFPKLTVEY
ncbi:hypothetical protein H5410_062256 [Solanum commersonii]|uniref:Uncharacterized protein n=1 Tax=Solanum commersonii TaxID=4109 RepID=A0A9J5WAD3_SOLCO|nr:hypothetical protein H5410_062256 [Solanum commersonii]